MLVPFTTTDIRVASPHFNRCGQTYPVSSHQLAGIPSPEISPSELSNYPSYPLSGPATSDSSQSGGPGQTGYSTASGARSSGFLGRLTHAVGSAARQIGNQVSQQLVGTQPFTTGQPMGGGSSMATNPGHPALVSHAAAGQPMGGTAFPTLPKAQRQYLLADRLLGQGLTPVGDAADDIFGDGMDMHIFSDRMFCEKQAALPYNNGYGYSSLLAALLRQRAVALLLSSDTATAERYIKDSQENYTRCMTHGGTPAPGWAQYDENTCRGNLTTGFYTKGLYTFVGPDFYARLTGKPQIDGFASTNLCLQGPSGTTCHTASSAVDVPPGDTHTTNCSTGVYSVRRS